MISTIKEKLTLLRQIDTKFKIRYSKKYQYKSIQLTEASLIDFEEHLGIKLPSEYRQYLQEVGYGMGPGGGFYPPEEILDEYFSRQVDLKVIRGISGTSPANPFPFSKEDALNCFEQLSIKPVWEVALEGLYPENGAIPIIEDIFLVTKGELVGTLWDVHCDAVTYGEWSPIRPPSTIRAGIKPVKKPLQTFYEWYNDWLDDAIEDVKKLYEVDE